MEVINNKSFSNYFIACPKKGCFCRFAAFGAGESTSLRILREDRSNKKDSDNNEDDDDEDDSRKQTVSERISELKQNLSLILLTSFAEMDINGRKPEHSPAGMDGRPSADRRLFRLPPRARREGDKRRVRNRSAGLHSWKVQKYVCLNV